MCDFSRVSAWFCDEKISLKKSCFYLYIRRNDVSNRATSATCKRHMDSDIFTTTSHEERLSTSLITPILLPSGECLAVVVYIR